LVAFPDEEEVFEEEPLEASNAEPEEIFEEAAPPPRRPKTSPFRPSTSPLPAIDLDLDSLAEGLADISDEAGGLWDVAPGDASGLIDDTISGEEAMQLGLLSQDDES